MQRPTSLIDAQTLEQRVNEMARQIDADYADADELCLVGVLKGAFIFLADLSRALTIRRRVDFVAVASYGDSTTSDGNVRLIMDLRTSIAGKHVLIVDDIIDTGSTLGYLMRLLDAHQPASIKSCILIKKDKNQDVEVAADYLGFEIPDVWVVGYGLDFADRQRTLPYIGQIEPDAS